MDYPVSFNIMEDVGADKRHLVVSGLMNAFKKIWEDQWSARMEYILNNALLALLEYPGSTILGVNRIFADKAYRKKVVANVTDPSVKAFWEDEFAKYSDRFATEATAAIQNKVGQFISNPLIRNIIGQSKSSFDVRKMMDEKKIIIINLSKGLVGDSNANLLGSFLVTKIYLAAMSRSDVSQAEMRDLPNFYFYVDEFQSFANESFAEILSEARKYKLNLTIAHQYIEQMSEEVREAVFGNVGTLITFRVGAYDAEILEKEFAPEFTAEDLVNLGKFQMYLKLMVDALGSRPFSATSIPPIETPKVSYKEAIIAFSREKFSKPRAVVEDEIKKWHEINANNNSGSSNSTRKKSFPSKPLNKFNKKPAFNSEPRTSERERELRKAVSLDYLKSKKTKKRTPSKQNVNELKKALSSVLKEAQLENKPVKEEIKKPETLPETNNSSQSSQKEVSEDILKKVLDVKEKK
jgi:hypothetical protein